MLKKLLKNLLRGYQKLLAYGKNDSTKDIGTITNCCKQVDYDLKHGVTIDEVIQVLHKIKDDETFAPVLQSENAILRFNEIEKYVSLLKES